MTEPFATSLEHVLAELELVDIALRLHVHQARQIRVTDDRFAGLYISEQDVDALCAEPAGLPRWATTTPPNEAEVQRAFDALSTTLAARKARSLECGIALRLERVTSLFKLERFDVRVLLVCLAPEIDLRYQRLFAYLQDDVQKRKPSVDLVLNLLCPTLIAKLEARARFAASAPLIEHRLIELFEDSTRSDAPLIGKDIRVDTRIAGFLLDCDEVDPQIARYARCLPAASVNASPMRNNEAQKRSDAIARYAGKGPLLVNIQGPHGVGKRDWAAATATRAGAPLLLVEGDELLADKEASFETKARCAVREAALRGAALYWSGADALLLDDHRWARKVLVAAIERYGVQAYLAGASAWDSVAGAESVPLLRVVLPIPSSEERLRIWQTALGDALPAAASAELPAIAAKFRVTAEDIAAAATDARARASYRCGALESSDLYAACRARSGWRLGQLAKKIEPRYRWGDLVLPADALKQLREICEQIRLRSRVFEDWGFERKLSLGKGLHTLFAGPSGTGKTMAAEIMAGELGLDLYKIDLSGVVSKYIGETEKNLARIFTEAEATSAILFFDEADALFGKRSDVQDAHDRYANIETSYLLQRMEEYEGVTLLATNLRRNMDDAFLRRLAFAVQFPFPEEAERLRIWRGVFPEAMPRDADLDLEFMARQFKLAGGNIKNVALAAAFLAASSGRLVGMTHIIHATRRELQKIGKTHVNAEFGAYSSLLEA